MCTVVTSVLGPCEHPQGHCCKVKTLRSAFAQRLAQVWSFSQTKDAYPYLFVLPLYRLLKVRNLPDITRLFLLQLSDFLRKGTDRKKADGELSRKKMTRLAQGDLDAGQDNGQPDRATSLTL